LNFWLVAQEGSVQRASELLHVTPATVSIQIRQLERSLGVKLFRKQGRGLALTDIGAEVQHYASDIFSTGRELVEMVRGNPVGKPLTLRIGIRDAMPKLLAFRLLEPALTMKDPVKIICHEGDMSRMVADLAVHKLDIVLTDTPLDPRFRVQAYSHLLHESEVVVMGIPELAEPLIEKFPRSLNHAPFLLPTTSSMLRRSLDQWFNDSQIQPDIRGEFDDSAMLKIAGSTGVGLFAIPSTIQEEVQATHGVVFVGKLPGIRERFYAVSVERKSKHPAVVAISQAAPGKTIGRG
jgi:LysR family transcriptional activator of nhaA